jgi:pimeloyl-ACP methyl ester carboxylesterase
VTFRTAATTAIVAVVLAAVGSYAGPQWDPQPVTDHVELASSSTAIGGAKDVAQVGTYPVRVVDTTVNLANTTVTARVREPVGAPAGRPGVVFVHGAGTGDSTTAFDPQASAMASAGIVTVVPSKNQTTYSLQHRDYVQMAGDYERSVALLQSWPGVDPAEVGVYAESEGTWIAPIMADEDPTVAFTIMTSAPVVRPREQAAFAVNNYLRNTDVPQGVFRAIPRAVGMKMPGGGLDYADFDVKPYLDKLEQPTLVVYGTGDASMPVEQGAEAIVADAKRDGNEDVTVRYYKDADHGIHVGTTMAPGFLEDISDWVDALPDSAGAAPRWAGAQPDQEFLAGHVPSPHWFGNGDWILGSLIVAIGLALVTPLMWLLTVVLTRRRRFGRRIGAVARDLRTPLLLAAVGSVMTLVALVVYLYSIARLAVDYATNALMVQGGWLGLRVLGLATLVPVAVVINRLSDRRVSRRGLLAWLRARVRTDGTGDTVGAAGSASTIGSPALPGVRAGQPVARGIGGWALLVSLTVATIALLITTAYWGVFQLGV